MVSVFGPVALGIFQVLGPNIPKQRTKTITILIVHIIFIYLHRLHQKCNQNATMIGGCACCVLPSGSHAIERKPTNDFPHPLPPHHQHSRC